ncbi:MAG: hypothetical protein WDN03_08905 [Rhizomicrobium sp.]
MSIVLRPRKPSAPPNAPDARAPEPHAARPLLVARKKKATITSPYLRASDTVFYETLMSVSFRHTYYNLDGEACPDFTVEPTLATARLMQSLGLIFRDQGSGFSVFCDISRTKALLSFLARNEYDGPEPGQYWTRLSFILICRNPYFANITALPLDLSSALHCYYLGNQFAHMQDETVLLTPGRSLTAEALQRVIDQQTAVPLHPHDKGVEALALSGARALWEPRCVIDAAGKEVCLETVYLDFSQLPQGEYTLRYVLDDGGFETIDTGVYAAGAPIAYAFADLLFSSPTAISPGIYPADLAAGTLATVNYVLPFEARATYWIYYIVQQSPATPFTDLRIETRSGEITFWGPEEVTLPTGARAACFTSDMPLHLRQKSPYDFTLYGKHPLEQRREREIVPRLPVAGPQQVQSRPSVSPFSPALRKRKKGRPDACYSLIYVYV